MELKNMPPYGIVFGVSGFMIIIIALAIFSNNPVMGLGLSAIGYTLLVGSITFFSHNSLKEKIDKILNQLPARPPLPIPHPTALAAAPEVLVICPECGTHVSSESKFCPECGEDLRPKRKTKSRK